MNPKNYFLSIPQTSRTWLLAGVSFIVLLTALLLWWVLSPREQLLFGNLREAEAAEIVKSLNEWKIPHDIGDGGSSISVAADKVYETRMRLISAGVPKGGHVGFELFDDADFGVTEFAQRVNYQRALQGEIERTIISLPNVEAARVHLTIRRSGLFVGDHETSKASVAITLRPGETLSRQQVNGIRSLVAAAVEGLTVDAVSVLDSSGSLLAAAGADGAGTGVDDRTDEQARIEERIRQQVSQLLEQVVHDENFQVSVDATLNFDSVHEVNERPLAQGDDGNGLISRKQTNTSSGASSNGANQNHEEAEYLHGTERQEISRAPGRLERLSIAVVLPANFDELAVPRIQALVAAAAGIDEARGDRLVVSRVGLNHASRAEGQPATHPVGGESQGTLPIAIDASKVDYRGLLKWLPLLIGVLLLGTIVGISTQRRPRQLKAVEREAVLAKLRGWLADGSMP
jgi:flagellar M-ring protein FliF